MFDRQGYNPRSAYEIRDFVVAILRVFYWLYEILQLDACASKRTLVPYPDNYLPIPIFDSSIIFPRINAIFELLMLNVLLQGETYL